MGTQVNLDKIDLAGLSKEITELLKNADAIACDKLLQLQKSVVHSEMITS